MSRQTVNVLTQEGQKASTIELPKVFDTPIRAEVVKEVYVNLAKNAQQPHANDPMAGKKVSAISWGTGRAKACVPRVNGSGSNRNGQGAYANFCRGGHRFNPPTLLRRWFRPVPSRQRKFAIASAIAATAVVPLVQARGHVLGEVKEVPIVVVDAVQEIKRTRDAVELLKKVGVYGDVQRVLDGSVHRSSKGKFRRAAYKTKKGPLVIYNEDKGIVKAFRNIPGVETISVKALALAKLAPAAQVGRLTVWTESAFKALDGIYESKKRFSLPRSIMTNADIEAVITSDAVQSVLNEKKEVVPLPKCRCCKKLSVGACEDWQKALKEVAELRAAQEAKRTSPEVVKAVFAEAVAAQPATPDNMSTQIINHIPL
ncbi:ribosomal protein, putative [Trichomonas vaginalis G3]|uniref:Large ribosomal subunit protein uL4 n=1 Tax=Trichomonas vaginalis (strain ATCC PRA-98 / G3) TaxID=412133 RepID=A2E1Z6_TRIV3|nr:structural constituent of ribosome [Trichomonas vaginalis G3]EAY13345.1 ribosomal protein, putative [Trichomonas vaginalis G3]KAI5540386.1 structural constituent of ribosome [Trichomonas vaginalis G3]|eukprot:XP_001325568.1 ribosomal protein [Trichomonas vaginalis G3]